MGMMILPAKAGTCSSCATEHGPNAPHNWWSLFYGMRFKAIHGRDATHADAVAHLDADMQRRYREAIEERAISWSEPDGPAIPESCEVSR